MIDGEMAYKILTMINSFLLDTGESWESYKQGRESSHKDVLAALEAASDAWQQAEYERDCCDHSQR